MAFWDFYTLHFKAMVLDCLVGFVLLIVGYVGTAMAAWWWQNKMRKENHD